jgi:hypothetical protein
MHALALVLKLLAPVFVLVGALHLTLGVGADVMLGAKLSAEAITDPALDSQNRFYGVAFSIYGVLLFLCSTDIPKYTAVLRCLLWVFFVAGVARFVSVALYGVPPPLVVVLLISELTIPPALAWWLSRVANES